MVTFTLPATVAQSGTIQSNWPFQVFEVYFCRNATLSKTHDMTTCVQMEQVGEREAEVCKACAALFVQTKCVYWKENDQDGVAPLKETAAIFCISSDVIGIQHLQRNVASLKFKMWKKTTNWCFSLIILEWLQWTKTLLRVPGSLLSAILRISIWLHGNTRTATACYLVFSGVLESIKGLYCCLSGRVDSI